MKKFLSTTFLAVITVLIFLELIIRATGITGSALPFTSLDGEYKLMPGEQGIWVNGPLGNIRSRFQINNQGYNSTILDYENDPVEFKIALIGDSYIQGLHVNVEESIGRLIEDIYTHKTISVHEFGISSWNAYNFLQIAKEIEKKYDYIFVLVTDEDLSETQKSNPKPTNSYWSSYLHKEIRTLRYLNINRGLMKRLKRIGPRKRKINSKKKTPIPNYDLLQEFPKNTVFLYEEKKLNSLTDNGIFLKINHIKKPIDFGYVDGHWNSKGRNNCASTIVNFLNKQDNDNKSRIKL